MPVYGISDIVSEGLKRWPNMPAPPDTLERVVNYLAAFDKSFADSYDQLSQRLQSYTSFTTTLAFGAADSSKTLVFATPLEDDKYTPLLIPSWNATLWVTSVSETGFTVNASAAPGGAGGTVRVAVVR